MQTKSPKQNLSALTLTELEKLASDIRSQIIEVLSKNGGHLASNLGVVELTIALHRVFESPIDKFIFDVSHQTYPHKILTDRKDRFNQIRQFGGLCGFSNPKESIHDHFYAGHAGTALSLSLGVAATRDLEKEKFHVISILGDASLTCGLTLEALNNVAPSLNNFITILNDNEMSISKNVGNIKNILSRLLSNPVSNGLYFKLQNIFSKIPKIGPKLAKLIKKLSQSLKNIVSPATFFEEFNLSYVGPIDGHNLSELISTFEALKNISRPVVVHVLTTKGKGMEQAIKHPTPYHGAKPFDKVSGKFIPSKSSHPTFPKIFGSHLLKMAKQDSDIVCITPAMPAGSCLEDFMTSFPDRCIDVGIAEGHALTLAGGLAYQNKKKVVVCIYATFLQRALDNLFHDICMQQNPLVIAIDRASISGPDGSTHHGIYDISFLNTMPHLVITQPRDGHLLKELIESAWDWNRIVAIRYPNLETQEPNIPIKKRDLGKAEILQKGADLAIITLGHTYKIGLEIIELLKEHKIHPTLIDPIFLKPFDEDLFQKICDEHKFIVTIEEHALNGGMSMIFNNFLIQNKIHNVEVLNFGIPDEWVQFGMNHELMSQLRLDKESITKAILQEFFFHDHSPLSERKETALI